jgi:hypothetical protein
MEKSAQQDEQPSSMPAEDAGRSVPPKQASRDPLAHEILYFLKEHRDGFLVVGAAVYALGFVTWAIHSWRFGIGYIDVFKAQYIVAGLLPTFLISGSLIYISQARPHSQEQSGVKWRGYAVVGCFIFAIVHVLETLVKVLSYAGITLPDHVTVFGPIVLGSSEMELLRMFGYMGYRFLSSNMFLYIFYLVLSVNIFHWLRSCAEKVELRGAFPYVSLAFAKGVALGVVLLFLLLSTMAYALDVFPSLPPEIGGGQERCARLDVQLDKLSQKSAKELIEQAKVPLTAESPLLVGNEIRHYAKATEKKMTKQDKKDETAEETVTTREIYVVYMSDKSLWFSRKRLHERAQKFEVSREAISLISWCVRSDPA